MCRPTFVLTPTFSSEPMPTPLAAQPTPATQRGVRLRSWMRSLTLLALITNTAGSPAPVAAQSGDEMWPTRAT